jgi:hypothetical protein
VCKKGVVDSWIPSFDGESLPTKAKVNPVWEVQAHSLLST